MAEAERQRWSEVSVRKELADEEEEVVVLTEEGVKGWAWYEALRREEKMLRLRGREARRPPRLRLARMMLSKRAMELDTRVGFGAEVERVAELRSRSSMNSLNAAILIS